MNPSTVRTNIGRAPRTDPFVGSRYRALEELATSPTGALYVVEHVELGKRFAAKTLRPELLSEAGALDRLRLEAQALGRLRHPNIVAITGFDRTSDGTPFIVMELLKGRTLAEELVERPALALSEALDLAKGLASALEAMHAIGIVHRDVAPENVFLHRTATGQLVPKLLDFGSVRVQPGQSQRSPAPLSVPTRTGTILGTPGFRSPEQSHGWKVDARTDIYQLGLVLYRAVTGNPALAAAREAVGPATWTITPPSRCARGDLPLGLDGLILKALAFDPADRFQSAAEFRAKLDEFRMAIPAPPVLAAAAFRGGAEKPSSVARARADLAWRSALFVALALLGAALVIIVGLHMGGPR